MINFTYNPIIPADYKSQRERTSLRSLSLLGYLFLYKRVLPDSNGFVSSLRFGRCKANVHRTLCAPSRTCLLPARLVRVRISIPLRSALTKVLWTFSFSVPLRSVLTKVHWTFSTPSHALLIHKRYPWGALHKEGAPRWRIARQTAFRWRCPHRFATRSLGII